MTVGDSAVFLRALARISLSLISYRLQAVLGLRKCGYFPLSLLAEYVIVKNYRMDQCNSIITDKISFKGSDSVTVNT